MAGTKMPSASYWQDRRTKMMAAGMKKADEYTYKLRDAYSAASSEITDDLNRFYVRYGREEGLSLAPTRKLLKATEMVDFRKRAEAYSKEAQAFKSDRAVGYSKKLKQLSGRAYVTRMEELKANIEHHITMPAMELEETGGTTLADAYYDGYFQTHYDLAKASGFGVDFSRPGYATVKKVVQENWLGSSFSKRIWADRDKLVSELEPLLARSMVRSKGIDAIARELKAKVGGSLSNSIRLIQTETSRIANQASIDAYRKSSIVEKYEYVATLDLRTSEICSELDGKLFDLVDASVGVNLPPMHPYCRSTTIPHFPDDEIGASITDRVARDENGKTYRMGKNVTYKKWLAERDPGRASTLPVETIALMAGTPPGLPEVAPLDLSEMAPDEIQEIVNQTNTERIKEISDKYKFDDHTKTDVYKSLIERSAQIRSGRNLSGTYDTIDPLELYRDLDLMSLGTQWDLFTAQESFADPIGVVQKLHGVTREQAQNRVIYGKFMKDSEVKVWLSDYPKLRDEIFDKHQDAHKRQFNSDVTTSMEIAQRLRVARIYRSDPMPVMAKISVTKELPFGATAKGISVLYTRLYNRSPDTNRLWYDLNHPMDSMASVSIAMEGEANRFIKTSGSNSFNDKDQMEEFMHGFGSEWSTVDAYMKIKDKAAADAKAEADKKEADRAAKAAAARAAKLANGTGGAIPYKDAPPKSLLKHTDHMKKWAMDKLTPEGRKNRQDVIPVIKEIMDNSQLCSRVPGQDSLKAILKSGKFKSQIEIGGQYSQGTNDPEGRKKVSSRLFGHDRDKDGLSKQDYEVYGYIGPNDISKEVTARAGQYGNVVVRFKKDRVAHRATFTVEDSLGPGLWGELIADSVSNPQGVGINFNFINGKQTPFSTNWKNWKDQAAARNDDPYDPHRITRDILGGNSYMEAQYHGDLTPDDIESVHVLRLGKDRAPDKELADLLTSMNIPMYWADVDPSQSRVTKVYSVN